MLAIIYNFLSELSVIFLSLLGRGKDREDEINFIYLFFIHPTIIMCLMFT